MISEIGIVVGLYVLARLFAEDDTRAGAILRILTAVVTVVVLVDLSVQGVTSRSLMSRLPFFSGAGNGSAPPSSVPSPAADARGGASALQAVTRADGGAITTTLGYGIAVAKDSTLKREWLVVHDAAFPADLDGTPGVSTVYIPKEYSGEYRYRAAFTLTTREPIQAVQIVFLTFDVWGNHVRTLSFEEVADIPAGQKEMKGEWSLLSENDVEKHYASIGYVARVRLGDGRVVEAPTDTVVAEARKFSAKFSPSDLETKSGGRGGA
jgi:hypothetical protein